MTVCPIHHGCNAKFTGRFVALWEGACSGFFAHIFSFNFVSFVALFSRFLLFAAL